MPSGDGVGAAGFRVLAPDYISFGRSDKLVDTEHYSFQSHFDRLVASVEELALPAVTAWPDQSYKSGAGRFLTILPIRPDDSACLASRTARDKLADWTRTVLTLSSAGLAATSMGPEPIQAHIPGARGQAHAPLDPAGSYIVEDQAAELVAHIAAFAGGAPSIS